MTQHTHKIVNGERVELTAEEKAQLAAEESAWAAGAKDRHNQQAQRQRAAAYAIEADPLFFKSQRGEATAQQWQDKVADIKARFPYQE
jgi:hypothetical protein